MNPLIPIFVTGAVALLGLIITKESKVSEFRQAWIDNLRTEIADLLASIHLSLLMLRTEDGTGIKDRATLPAEAISKLAMALRDANTALFTIRLRLNPTEPDSIALLTTLDEMEQLSNNDDALAGALASGTSSELEARLITQAKRVLSAEWVRVKTGEPYFKWTRRFAAALFVAIAMIVVWQTVNSSAPPTHRQSYNRDIRPGYFPATPR
jgi:hypothetical protein